MYIFLCDLLKYDDTTHQLCMNDFHTITVEVLPRVKWRCDSNVKDSYNIGALTNLLKNKRHLVLPNTSAYMNLVYSLM